MQYKGLDTTLGLRFVRGCGKGDLLSLPTRSSCFRHRRIKKYSVVFNLKNQIFFIKREETFRPKNTAEFLSEIEINKFNTILKNAIKYPIE